MFKVCTDVITDMFKIKWTIKRFTVHCARVTDSQNVVLQGPPFLMNGYGEQLAVCMHLCMITETFWCKLKLHGNFNSKESHSSHALVTVAIVRRDGTELGYLPCMHLLNFLCPVVIWENRLDSLISLADIKSYDDDLTFVCRIEVFNEVVSTLSNSAILNPESEILPRCYAELFENEEFTDITFVFDDKKLRAHKVICAGYSSVFAAMFEHPMRERNENEVKIDDIDYDVFKKMLRFIYTNEIDDLEKTALDLLYAADKYDLQELKEKCAESIRTNINVDNAVESLIAASRHNLDQLMETVQEFVKHHILAIIKTPGFKSMQKDHPDLACMILRTSLRMIQDK